MFFILSQKTLIFTFYRLFFIGSKIQLSKGNNGLVKTKYLTFGIEADNPKLAKHRLERIENDIRLNFKRMGVATSALNGQERLRLMHGIFHMDGDERFAFDWNWLPPS